MTTFLLLVILKIVLFCGGCFLLVYSGFLASQHKDKRFMFATVAGMLCLWACGFLSEEIRKASHAYMENKVMEELENTPKNKMIPCKVPGKKTLHECMGLDSYSFPPGRSGWEYFGSAEHTGATSPEYLGKTKEK